MFETAALEPKSGNVSQSGNQASHIRLPRPHRNIVGARREIIGGTAYGTDPKT